MTDFPETARGQVRPGDCNAHGELATPAMTARLGDAVAHVLGALGHGPRDQQRRGVRHRILEERINRVAPLRAGEVFHVDSRLAEGDGSRLVLDHRLVHSAGGQLAATATTVLEGTALDAAPAAGDAPADHPGLLAWRGRVAGAECDQMRHMNVQYYMEKGSQALAGLAAAIGLAEAERDPAAGVLAPVADRVAFTGEVHDGDLLSLFLAVRGVDGDRMRLAGLLRADETGHVAARFETEAALRHLQSGEVLPLPAAARARLDDLARADEDVFTPPRAITGPASPDGVPAGAVLTCRRSVNAWEVDNLELATPTFQVSCISDGAVNLFSQLGADLAWRNAHNIGSAALEYSIRYHRPLPLGQPVTLYSHFLELLNRPFRFGHHLVDSATGEVVTAFTVTAVLFDLEARKAIQPPDHFHDNARALIAATRGGGT